jgi:hypothetical protein
VGRSWRFPLATESLAWRQITRCPVPARRYAVGVQPAKVIPAAASTALANSSRLILGDIPAMRNLALGDEFGNLRLDRIRIAELHRRLIAQRAKIGVGPLASRDTQPPQRRSRSALSAAARNAANSSSSSSAVAGPAFPLRSQSRQLGNPCHCSACQWHQLTRDPWENPATAPAAKRRPSCATAFLRLRLGRRVQIRRPGMAVAIDLAGIGQRRPAASDIVGAAEATVAVPCGSGFGSRFRLGSRTRLVKPRRCRSKAASDAPPSKAQTCVNMRRNWHHDKVVHFPSPPSGLVPGESHSSFRAP